MSTIVIALGGNALGNNPTEQKELVKIAAKKIAELVKPGNKIIVGHGNGPQVGMIVNTFAATINKNNFSLPFPEAGGMSQGYIGYHLLTGIKNELILSKKSSVNPVYFLTQTIVDKNDPSFNNPTKPVGPFYPTLQEAQDANPNSTIKEDSGRGFRKVVASPLPLGFLGFEAMEKAVNENNVVIVGGGGGIPTIIENDGTLVGVDGVIDKDFTLSKFASMVKADKFIILTAVDRVCINFGQPNQKELETITVSEAKKLIQEKQFGEGSMLPKVQAAIDFVSKNNNGQAIIANLNKLKEAIDGTSGTVIKL